jgi:hypothetical protein
MNQLNKTILRDESELLLETIAEQFETIKAHENRIPRIELDIILENIRKLYENLHLLSRMGDTFSQVTAPKTELPAVKPSVPATAEDNELQKPYEKPVMQPAVKIRVESAPAETQTMTQPAPSRRAGEIDLFSTESTGFQEKLKETREKSYASERLSSQRKDLKASISINEKFLFINELFDGNLREYNITIETLTGFGDLREALDFLDLLRIKNLWESESMAFKRLRELVEKQF